ncbi:transglutaminase-like cysteine peptidase [Glaciecola siphonariae]|uniref:Transglutaminase-like cysteine peptidase n=1 Tax=Glaciecola siphonariae TaxID=521012 RepID=A0ABV9LU21_9ALTE
MTSEYLFNQIKSIHRLVLNNFEYNADQKTFNVRGTLPENTYDGTQYLVGDCEDFALACRKLCRDAEILHGQMVMCIDCGGSMHCVFEVGGWILDCRQAQVMARDDLAYDWVAVRQFSGGGKWTAL